MDLTKKEEHRREEFRGETVEERQQEQDSPSVVFRDLETWDLTEGEQAREKISAFMDERILRHSERNRNLQTTVRQNFPQNDVDFRSTAPVEEPPVQQPAAGESWKQRRERLRKKEVAQKLCPIGDEHTLDIEQSLREQHEMRGNSLKLAGNAKERARKVNADVRMLRVFCRGYRKNWRGKPATERDRQAMLDDKAFLEDYLSGDAQRRLPHLERATEEILNIELTRELLTPEYIIKNAAELKRLSDRMTTFENMMKENPDYYNSLPQMKKDLIEANGKLCAAFTYRLSVVLTSRGIDVNNAKIIGHKDKSSIRTAASQLEATEDMYDRALETYSEESSRAFRNEIDRQVAKYREENLGGYREIDEVLGREGNPMADINFASPAVNIYTRQAIVDVRNVIQSNPEKYRESKELIDRLYTEYFRCNDAIADLMYTSSGIRDLQTELLGIVGQGYKSRLNFTYEEVAEEIEHKRDVLFKRADAIKYIIEHYLKGKEMSPDAVAIHEEFTALL